MSFGFQEILNGLVEMLADVGLINNATLAVYGVGDVLGNIGLCRHPFLHRPLVNPNKPSRSSGAAIRKSSMDAGLEFQIRQLRHAKGP